MPSLRHDGLVELIRQHPPLALDLVRLADAYPIPDDVAAVLGSEDMTDVAPVAAEGTPAAQPRKYTADSVVIAADPNTGRRLLAVVVEPQGKATADKDISWPVYVSTARKANKCPRSALIVLCWNVAEARKCRRTIMVGPRDFNLNPDVIDRTHAPNLGKAGPYMVLCFAVLRAVNMRTDEGRQQVLSAIVNTGAAGANHRYLRKLMLGIAPNAASRQRLEELMATTFKRDFIDDLEDAAEARGLARGQARGEARGQARGEALSILRLMDARGLNLTEGQRKQVVDCADVTQLGLWFDRAIAATTADEVFGS